MVKWFAWLGGEIYGSLFPVSSLEGAQSYFLELWNRAPKKVALTQAILLLFMAVTPLILFGRLRLFPTLSRAEKESIWSRLQSSRVYALRLVAYGLRGHALMAILRDPAARLEVLSKPSSERRSWEKISIGRTRQITL